MCCFLKETDGEGAATASVIFFNAILSPGVSILKEMYNTVSLTLALDTFSQSLKPILYLMAPTLLALPWITRGNSYGICKAVMLDLGHKE